MMVLLLHLLSVSFKIFVSYSSKDLSQVDRFTAILEQPGTEVFVAEYAVQPGAALAAEIQKAIAGCDLCILFWSEHARESGWVTAEVARAQTAGKQIIPVLLAEQVELPVFLRDTKYLSAQRDPESATQWLQQNVFDRAQKHQQAQGLAWLGIGAALIWILSE